MKVKKTCPCMVVSPDVTNKFFLFMILIISSAHLHPLCKYTPRRVSTKGDTLQQAMEIGNKINSTDRFIFSESVFVGHKPP
ncbi:MAG: hypothetical protein KGY70_15545, partial [Bacteroidales bacterium]|nr:hypothetical protein [Bacteroidales bacterium]